MNGLQEALIAELSAKYELANPVGRVSILGRVVDVLGGSVGQVLHEQGQKGWPSPMFMALGRVLAAV